MSSNRQAEAKYYRREMPFHSTESVPSDLVEKTL
jgi:hypothetical protein